MVDRVGAGVVLQALGHEMEGATKLCEASPTDARLTWPIGIWAVLIVEIDGQKTFPKTLREKNKGEQDGSLVIVRGPQCHRQADR